MNNGVKIGIGIAAAALVLWGIGMLGHAVFSSDPARDSTITTRPTTTDVTYQRPGATTTTVAPTASNGDKLVTKIALSTYEVTVAVGETQMPWVTMTPDDAPDKREIWSSSDPSVATVDDIGNIKGVKKGTCTVTVAATANPSVSAQVKVTVTEATATTSASKTTDVGIDALIDQLSSKATEPTYIQGILIANKTYGLPKNFNPGASSDMLAAFATMKQDAAGKGLTLINSSNFRSYSDQIALYKKYVEQDGQAAADTYSARPGFSEHQTGLVIDLNSVDDSFANTPEAAWVAQNAHKYGFIVRYPKGKEAITGYQYEPWHIRYLGVDTATAVYQSGKTLEEYLGITSVYAH